MKRENKRFASSILKKPKEKFDDIKAVIELNNAIIETITDLVESRDNTIYGHIVNTSKYLKVVIEAVMTSESYKKETIGWDVELMVQSARLHDVGKIEIDEIILRKPRKLTDTEYEVIKRHTLLGGEIINRIQNKTGENDFLNFARGFAVYHHEKWDGTGYPYGLDGENIPLPGRIMAIVDVYDTLVSERPYKKPFTHEEAVKIVMDAKGSSFDPVLADVFLSVSDKLPSVAWRVS